MPGPVIKFSPPDAANLASRLPGPLRKPAGGLLQVLFDRIGADDPMGGVYPPLVSMFRDVNARKEATEAFRNVLSSLPQNLRAAAGVFADRYPRIAAHTRIVPAGPAGETSMSMTSWPVTGTAKNVYYPNGVPMPIRLHPLGRARHEHPEWGLENATEDLFHEGTHVAQRLGNKDFNKLYDLGAILKGYVNNPFEGSAREIGWAARESGDRLYVPYNAIRELREIANKHLNDRIDLSVVKGTPSTAKFDAAREILEILDKRLATPMKAPR